MRRFGTCLVLLLAGAVLLLKHATASSSPSASAAPPSAAPHAASDVSAPTPASEEKTSPCAAPAPKPSLLKDAYRGYSFERGPDNSALERASTGTLHIEIRYSGCRDGIEHGFLFEEDDPRDGFRDRDHWLQYAAEQLQALKTYRRAQEDVRDLLPFLDSAKSAATRADDSELRLETCRDASAPGEDGCSLQSGGGHRFAVRQLSPRSVGVYVSRYYALKTE